MNSSANTEPNTRADLASIAELSPMNGEKLLRWLTVGYALTTAVGVALHELAHKWFAEERGLAIDAVVYFQLRGEAAGYVRHETPTAYRELFAVAVAPIVVNSAVGVAAFSVVHWLRATPGIAAFTASHWAGFLVAGWLGAACCLHAFPSRTDLNNTGEGLKTRYATAGAPRLQSWLAATEDRHWLLAVALSPIRVGGRILQTAWFLLTYLGAVVTIPLVLLLGVCVETKRYGSHVVYTLFIFWLTAVTIDRYGSYLMTAVSHLT